MVILSLTLVGIGTAREVKDYTGTINDFKESSDVAPFFNTAYGYAVFPSIAKGGLGIGAAHGNGQVYAGGEVTGFTSVTNISWGLQAGGQAYSMVIFFQDERAFKEFTSGNFEFGADAAAIAVNASAGASADTTGGGQAGASSGGSGGSMAKTNYHKGMLIFTIGKGGLMYEATISGQKYKYNPLP
jgi:lipid-binding SYLF domain-containing protein